MKVLVCYDVARDDNGARRLRKVARICEDYGIRVQYSVFECLVDPAQLLMLKRSLEQAINMKVDSLRYYHLGKNWKNKVEHVGAKVAIDMENDLLLF
ncbi:CRISPR-associated endonuclease Cas2 [Entomospira culicis]|uniref:CRISPR-associated endoribonuclease Cas2 n=1 Tax=Entomospira culicis TaxID=2719989 RepID=A0A968GEP6_9SPIO|nr:CRISPR-associated endonuclease Cas2 [Entomospira culicis]NIZ18923.1 CRISPR-associated endonuclease Cas2 [Entomospira culicis]NIZ69138.1 CRISPR-associated endonuclease Cas2 [Entomospira culicis]WDI37724.1 CRISPR-associated endonuclease Cas2 [Entomospira culicis]WDI39352.1 CRISPR-associated endonuclease Cas2 [Entomospira culicis]